MKKLNSIYSMDNFEQHSHTKLFKLLGSLYGSCSCKKVIQGAFTDSKRDANEKGTQPNRRLWNG